MASTTNKPTSPTTGDEPTGGSGPASGPAQELTPLEREVLEEYALLLENLDKLAPLLASLSTTPTAAVLDGLRVLERKTSLVSTLLKASVYSIVLQQQMLDED